MSEALHRLLQQTGMWRAASTGEGIRPGIPSEYPELDRHLPGGGWPRDGATELLQDRHGIGELRLLTPALSRLSLEQERWIAWLAPPHIPYPPALAASRIDLTRILIVNPGNPGELLWAAEKALASGSCSAALAWPGAIGDREIRRLQLAAREGNCWNILFRPASAAREHSPAELRIQLHPAIHPASGNRTIQVRILKRRGGWATEPFSIDLGDGLNRQSPSPSELILPATAARGEKTAQAEQPPWLTTPPRLLTRHLTGETGDESIQRH